MFSQQMKFSALVKINKHKNLSDSQIPSVGVGRGGGGLLRNTGFQTGFCKSAVSEYDFHGISKLVFQFPHQRDFMAKAIYS